MHGHELASMCLVLEGRFTEHHAAGEFTCAPRSVLVYPPDCSHREQFDAPRSRCFVVELPHAWIARTTEGPVLGRSGIQVTGGPLADIAVRMHHEMRAFDRASPLVLEGLMLEFLGLATRSRRPQPRAALRTVGARPRRAARAISRGHFTDPARAGGRPESVDAGAPVSIQLWLHDGHVRAPASRAVRRAATGGDARRRSHRSRSTPASATRVIFAASSGGSSGRHRTRSGFRAGAVVPVRDVTACSVRIAMSGSVRMAHP